MMETKLPALAAVHFGQKQSVRDHQRQAAVKASGEEAKQPSLQDTFVRFGCGSCG